MPDSADDAVGDKEDFQMLTRRILKYGIAFLCIFLVISIICIYEHRDFLASYFTNSISSAAGIGLYLLIWGAGMWLVVKSVFR